MLKRSIGLVLTAAALSLTAVCAAATVHPAPSGPATAPAATLKAFLNAAKTKNRAVIKRSIDWPGLAKTMGADKEKDPVKRKDLEEKLQIVFVEVFADMGKTANVFQVGDVSAKGNEAKGAFMKQDPRTKKLVPSTLFSLHKIGKAWQIYNIVSAAKH